MTGWQTLFYKEILRFWKVAFQDRKSTRLNSSH